MKEAEYYEPVKQRMEELFKNRGKDVHLSITATGNFSPTLKAKIPQNREIIFSFLKGKGQCPDITGFVQEQHTSDFIVVEIKKKIKLDDVYQAMKYKDLLNAKYAFLVSIAPIPEEIKRLCKLSLVLHHPSIYRFFVLAQFDENTKDFLEWFEENPFEKDFYWR